MEIEVERSYEKSYKLHGFLGSALLHGMLLAIFIFFLLTTPNPPLTDGGMGVELNYGTGDEGLGDFETVTEASNSPDNPDAAPSSQATGALTEEAEENVAKPAEEAQKEILTTEDSESETVVTKKEEKKPNLAVEKPKENKNPNPAAIMKDKPASNGNNGTSAAKAGGNDGDKPGTVGDQGDKDGTIDARSRYGNAGQGGDGQGGSGGSSLDIAGWYWASKPDKKDASSENGKIVFEIKVDDQGEITGVRKIESTVSAAVVKFYEQQVQNLTFYRTKDNIRPAPMSVGRITIIVKSR